MRTILRIGVGVLFAFDVLGGSIVVVGCLVLDPYTTSAYVLTALFAVLVWLGYLMSEDAS